jgi:hypothetical protein
MRASSFWVLPVVILGAARPVRADGGAQHQVKQTPPVKMGTSGGSVADHSSAFCCGGTLGCLVLRDGVLSILSNNHVLARSGSAAVGEDTLQPALIDSNCNGTNSNIVGDFAGDLVPLGSANVDAAIATARANVDSSGAILDVGVPCTSVQTPTIGLAVMKSGRTTGFTTGSITSINTSVSIQYQKGCNQGKKFNVTFTNQIVTGAMSAGGDSGSLLVSNDGSPNPVGLLFAGSGSTTIYNPIQSVVNAFTAGGHTFSFVGVSCATVDEGNVTEAPSAREIDAAMRVKVENELDLFRNPNVLGVGVGAAEDNPLEAVIIIYVESTREHPHQALPTEIDGVRVRVILTDRFVAQ